MKSQWQYWQHKTIGETFAVLVQIPDGVPTWEGEHVLEVAGPLHHSDVTLRNLVEGNFSGEPDDPTDEETAAEQMERLQTEYRVLNLDV